MNKCCTTIALCLCLVHAGRARADVERENTRALCTDGRDNDGDGHVDCADQDCQELAVCVPMLSTGIDDTARLRSRGTMRVVVGAVLLSLGVVVGGASAALWIASRSDYSGAEWKGAVSMDVLGLALIGAGTAVLALGAGDLAATRRSRVAVSVAGLAVRF